MSAATERVLSAQEQAIESGQKVYHGIATDRVLRILDRIKAFGPPRAAFDRAVAFTESFKETEGQPIVLRYAKALKRYAETAPIAIFDDELIVGRPCTWLGKWGMVYPELYGEVMIAGMEMFRKNKGKSGEVIISEEDEKLLRENLVPYWTGKDYTTGFSQALPEETRFKLYGPDRKNTLMWTLAMLATSTMRPHHNWTPDYSKILTRGVKSIREEAQAKRDALTPRELALKGPFLDAVMITCDAMVTWSRRYAGLARELAAKTTTPDRKQELLEIADVCERVPEHPARNFREALQAQWWGQMFNRVEATSGALGQGRWDQYMLPYYQKDIAEGRITKESAIELLHCVYLNMNQCVEIAMNPVAAAGTEGFSKFEDICLGGQTPDGKDATNELTYVILESCRGLPITCPEPCVRYHANTPDRLLHYVAEMIKDGKGMPKLENDEMIIPFYLAAGATMKEALDWNISGCCENRLPNRETHRTPNGGLNYGALTEMTFRNGKMKVLKDIQFGAATGDPRNWKTWEEVWNAFRTQVRYMGRHVLIQQYVSEKTAPKYFAAPMSSMLHDLAMEHCRDLTTHGEHFAGGIDHSCFEAIGKGTAVDSLAAVKHLIFDTKKLTWDQLLTAMEENWKGHEPVRQMCLNAPKYGNGIEWVDAIAYDIETCILEFLHENPKPHNQYFILRQIPVTFHIPMGKVTWATPNGRPAQEYLAEGISASHGMDVKGPTVLLGSQARGRNRSYREKGGDLINVKVSPATVAGEEGTTRLMQLIRTWSQLKHWHIQFNVLNKETLLAARKDPEKYRNLIVRIAGYSAFFVDLSPALQDEIIARNEAAL